MRLATFLHISDLHFGDIDPQTGNAVEPKFVGFHEVFDGLLGHSYHTLKRLSSFWSKLIRREREHVYLIVTGDLTTVGKVEQFGMASEYLGGMLDLTSAL